ncbi:MAG TPA: ABC transporter permease subunit [Candidatus Sulfotelmatobacter sp.]|nr:ABC transporter permease subunit [Candidatus Sulfotelmatobacter sp.]
MWFRTVYLKTLRDFRIPIFGWGAGLGLLIAVVVAAIPTLLGTAEARAAVVALGPSFAWFAEPIQIDTPGGYATWKYGSTVLLVAIWPILAETRMLRGEEERGQLDVLLSLPRMRLGVALQKLAAMWTALFAMAVVIGLLAYVGAAKVHVDFGLGDTILFGLNLALIAAVFGALALLISQFTQERRTAAGATGGLLLVSIVLDMVHRVVPSAEWVSRLSPVYYYNLSKPLIPSYGTNVGAMVLLMALTAVLSAAAVWLFVRRDVGGVVAAPSFLHLPQRSARQRRPLIQGSWSLRSVYTRSLGTLVMPTFWWTLGIAGFSGWMVVVVQQTESQLEKLLAGSPLLRSILGLGGSNLMTNARLLSGIFIFVPLMLMAFAVTQANRWSADEEDGRLELVLATPHPRLGVLLGRFAAVATSTVFIAVITWIVMALASTATGVRLDGANLAAATLSIVPLGLLVAAIGYLFAGWLRTAIDTGLLSFLLVIWFVITFVGPGLDWPSTTLRLSPFYYYGDPLLNGLPVLDTVAVLVVGAIALAVASARFVRKDIGT